MDRKLEEAIKTIVPTMQGWCSIPKAVAMAELIVENKPLVSVEIGVFGGSSLMASALAHNHTKIGHVFGIDPWSASEATKGMQDPVNVKWWGSVNFEAIYRGCLAALLDHELTHCCTLFRTTNERAIGLFDAIDILHIDGNHTEESSVLDVFLYLPKVRSGGHVWFDDVDWTEGENPTTRRALGFVGEKCERVLEIGNCALFRKL